MLDGELKQRESSAFGFRGVVRSQATSVFDLFKDIEMAGTNDLLDGHLK